MAHLIFSGVYEGARSVEPVYVVFYMFLNMRLYHYHYFHFHLYLPNAFLFNCRKKQLAFKYFGFERT
jgi:hypothetical protein